MAAKFELTGRVAFVSELDAKNEKYPKRTITIEEEGEYPNSATVEFSGEKLNLLDGVRVGQKVTVHFNLSAREWNGKYFQNLRGWKIDFHKAESEPLPEPPPVSVTNQDDFPF